MKRPAITILLLSILISMALISRTQSGKRFLAIHLPKKEVTYSKPPEYVSRLKSKGSEARTFALKKGYNPDFCFLIDMRLPSYQDRFFVYDLKEGKLLTQGLVAHGRCGEDWLQGRRYGNTVGCGCTSLGRYKVGYDYKGRFGLAFKLYGLDATNSNAFERFVVLHSHSCVPETEVDGEICQSDGCPTVAPGFLEQIAPMIKGSKKPVLLWIYE
jgi:hypothetical protein